MRAEFELRVTSGHGDAVLFWSAIAVGAGALLSGPLGLLVTFIDAQPPWSDAATYVASYRWWHQLPYWFGFGFVAAWVALTARLAALAPASRRTRTISALVAIAIYGAIISLNYTLQVAIVPAMVAGGDAAVGYLTMVNPVSIGWGIEMFGYGALGVSNLLAAPLFPESPGGLRPWIVRLMVLNGLVDIASAVAISIEMTWLLTPAGLAAYLFWNLLVVGTAAAIAIAYRPKG